MKKVIIIIFSLLFLTACNQSEPIGTIDFSVYKPYYEQAFRELNKDEQTFCKRIIESIKIESFDSFEILEWRTSVHGTHTVEDEIYINVDSIYGSFYRVYPKWHDIFGGYFQPVRFLDFYVTPIDMDLTPKGMDLNKVNIGIKTFLTLTQKDNVTRPPIIWKDTL